MTIYHELNKLLDQGMTVAVATITDVKGSVPREVGAWMAVFGDAINEVAPAYRRR